LNVITQFNVIATVIETISIFMILWNGNV